ncbi:uncharacterized protein LOC121623208 [Chelmon rostratus]|uniref:uncharacterized protein LOC121623208 n=1 Tax=Chelmon rostratus TaxID=109905 RepID=UPI001BE757CB|nr:uncharacterized protein LOC121623208 [Chelmon rostratus]
MNTSNRTSKVLIQSGSPTRYQLTPKKENIRNVPGGSLRRMTVGKKNPNKTNKTVLLVGETGTGKSTLINALVNYAMGVDWEDNVWFQIVEDEERSRSDSPKSDVIVYQIFGFEGKALPFSLTLIDTPGYGDTRGTEQDVAVAQRLLDLFLSEDGVREIDAVGLVLKATENRLSDRLRYVFDSVSSLFGKDMEKNVLVLVTHSDGRTPRNALEALQAANIKCAKDEKNQPVYFLCNNCQDADRQTEDIESLQQAVKVTAKGMSQFTDFLQQTEPRQLEMTVDVLKERSRLTLCIQNLQDRTETTELKQKEIQQTQEALREHEQEMKNNENFSEEVNEDYRVKESVDGGRTWCGLFYKEAVCCPVCEVTCQHPGYSAVWSPRHREVMKDGCCTVCTGKCPELHHVKDNWIYVNKTRTVQKTIDDMRKKYEKSKADREETRSLLEDLETNLEELQRERDQLLEESFQHVVTLEQIALNVNSLSSFSHLDLLIEKMKEKGDAEKVQKLEAMKSRVDEGVLAALQYKLTAAANEAMKNNKTSPKFKHVVSKSVLIQSGSPTRYQLTPKKENIRDVPGGSLRRMTVGEKNPNKTNKTVLLVGETGTGKSTLINALINYAMGVDWEDNVWFQIVEDEERSRSESPKSDVIVYQIFGFEGKALPFSLTLIDTPGYGDTRGTEQDVAVAQRLLDLFLSEDGVREIDAVGLVLKATENRLSDRLRYVFDSVSSLFGKDMEKNVVVLVTHSDGRTPKNALEALQAANIKCAKDEKNQPVYFLCNNCQDADRQTEDIESLQQAVKVAAEEMSRFTDFLQKTEPRQLETVIRNERLRLTDGLLELQDRVVKIELKQREILQNHHNEKVLISGGFVLRAATCCTACKETGHGPCKASSGPGSCQVMKGGRCTVCTRKCPASDHVKEDKKPLKETRKSQKSLGNGTEAGSELSLVDELQKEKAQLLDESFQHVVRLDQISLNIHPSSTYVHLDFLIEKMKEKGDGEKVRKLEAMKSRADGRTRAGLCAVLDKLKAAVSQVKTG